MKRPSITMIVTLAGVAGFELLVAPMLPLDRWQSPIASADGAIPEHCVEHTPFGNGVDFSGDYRCAGLAIDYHVGGVGRSGGKIWAGQWLFTDESGNYRLGMCTFNRGIHPRANVPAVQVTQYFPRDPSGAKRAYLTWRYGNTTDNLVAAGLWSVFHYYAQDAAGTNRAKNPRQPLVASLERISENSGRQDIEDLAITLDREAADFSGVVSLDVELDGIAAARASIRDGDRPVPGIPVTLTITGGTFDGGATAIVRLTDSVGEVRLAITGGPSEVTVTVTASSTAPAPSQVYRGAPVDPAAARPQTLITSGPADVTTDSASAELPPPTTTPQTTTPPTTTPPTTTPQTTTPPTTTPPAATTTTTATSSETTTTTTTTPEATTTTVPVEITTTTAQPATSTTAPAPTTDVVVVDTTVAPPPAENTPTPTILPPTTTAPPPPTAVLTPPPAQPTTTTPPTTLPRTGSSNGVAYVATSLLVAGVGVLGAIRRDRAVVGGGHETDARERSDFW